MLIQPSKPGFARSALVLCLLLPWLNGFTAGPSANFWPVWLAAVCGVAVLLLWRQVDARLLAQAWLAAALVSSALAGLQYYGLAAGLAPWVSVPPVGEAYANLRQRNQFASLTSIGLVCLLALPAFSRRGVNHKAGAWAYAAAALLALGNAASSSRTGFLQWMLILAVLLTAWALQARPRRGRLPTAAALSLWATCCYAVCLAALPHSLLAWQQIDVGSMAQRLAGSGQDSRRVLWDNVLYLIAQRPWLGWGWNELDFAHFVTLYPGARFTDLLDNAHNLPLHLAVELGLPLALAAGFGLGALVLRTRPWREPEPGRQFAWGVLAVIGVHSLLEYPLWYGPFHWASLLCVLWLWLGHPPGGKLTAVAKPAGHARRQLELGAAGLCWLALALVALDYARVSQRYLPATERWPSQWYPAPDSTLFFQAQMDFARLATTPLNQNNAADIHALALSLLHYSPEARVVEPLIASAILLGHDETAAFYLARYRAAFPGERWTQLLQRNPSWVSYLPD